MKVIVFKFTRLIPDVNGELPSTSAERSYGTVSEFDSGGCQQLLLNSCARARSGCGALDRVLGKRNWRIQNRKSFPDSVPTDPVCGFFFTRSRGERGGRRIGLSPRTPRLRVRPHPPFPLHAKKQFLISTSLSGRSPQAPAQRQTPSSAHKAMSGIRKKTWRRRSLAPSQVLPCSPGFKISNSA